MKYIILLILLLFSIPAQAGFHVGSSLFVLGAEKTESSYNVGYSKFFKNNLVLDFTTNIFYPSKIKFNKRGFYVKSKRTYGAILFGKKIGRYVLSTIVALVKVENSVYYTNINVDNYDNKAAVFGGHVTYFFTNNIAGSAFILLPNTNIDLKLSSSLGLNYYF